MKSNILIVDDEKEIRDLIEINLKNDGYNVLKAENGVKGMEILEGYEIHLVILDVMMPGMTGFEMCAKIRERSNIPILMLSAKGESMDKVQGMLTGADDYMVKPFDSIELVVKVKSLLRRAYYFNKEIKTQGLIDIQGLLINKDTHTVTANGNKISITATEFEILYLLASNRGRIFSSEEIFERVWNERYFDSNNTVMVHVSRLRDKIKKYNGGQNIIHTVWGVGYRIEK